LDIYSNKDSLQESFFEFAKNIKANGTLILHEGLPTPIGTKAKILRYGLSSQNNIAIEHLSYEGGKQIFEVKFDADSHTYKLTMPGQHNMLNAGAAIGVANILQINYDELSPSVESYLGVKRRFEFRIHTEKQVLIDDYAHHPTEIKAAIAAARQMFPGKKLMGIFQPHLYSRTRDFASDFMAELSKLDVVVLLDIYPARELPIEGVSSQLILDGITNASKFLVSKENICHFVEANRCEVVLIMGAGDIDRLVLPIEKTLQHHA
jgi:UDP-N-acetylmuramate--alanine ligase